MRAAPAEHTTFFSVPKLVRYASASRTQRMEHTIFLRGEQKRSSRFRNLTRRGPQHTTKPSVTESPRLSRSKIKFPLLSTHDVRIRRIAASHIRYWNFEAGAARLSGRIFSDLPKIPGMYRNEFFSRYAHAARVPFGIRHWARKYGFGGHAGQGHREGGGR